MNTVNRCAMMIVAMSMFIIFITQSGVGEVYTIHEDDWLYYELEDTTTDHSIEYEFVSGNDYRIDVFFFDDLNYNLYKNNEDCVYISRGSSLNSSEDYLYFDIYEDDTYYVVFDNTDKGEAKPPWDGVDNKATVDIEITRWYNPPGGGDPTDESQSPTSPSDEEDKAIMGMPPMTFLIFIIIIVVVCTVIAIIVVSNMEAKKKKEMEKRKRYVQGYTQGQRSKREPRYHDKPTTRKRSQPKKDTRSHRLTREDKIDLLEERLIRGEISEDTFNRLLDRIEHE